MMENFRFNSTHIIMSLGIGTIAFAGCNAEDQQVRESQPSDKPNIIWILADDIGYGDLGCYGNPEVETPNIDSLAAQGVQLNDFYVNAPVSSPARASLLTGRDPQRHGLTNVIETQDHRTHLSLDETLIAELLKKEGYYTGIIGKWHIGEPDPALPNNRGFDYFFGSPLGGLGFFNHKFLNGQHALFRNGEEVHSEGEYITDLLGKDAVRFIDQHKKEPFFLFLSFFAAHTGMGPESDNQIMQAPDRWIDYYKKRGIADERKLRFYGCVSAMDEAIGKVIQTLKRQDVLENTFIVFTSDNGPDHRNPATTASPYRGSKQTLWEGGIRVPCIVFWPGKITEGQTCDYPTVGTDLFPTTLAVSEIDKPDDLVLDGKNILPVLQGKEEGESRYLSFSKIRHTYFNSREKMVRYENWVWLNNELYNIETDLKQEHNVAVRHPEMARELERVWDEWVFQYPRELQRWKGKKPNRPYDEN